MPGSSLGLDAATWARLSPLLDEALELPPVERAAWLDRLPDDAADLRQRLRQRYHTATTVGFGPRFLHSTGQLHKGDAGRGLFLQFTDVASATVAIPDEAGAPASSISFAVLVLAQALGDRQALVDNQRRVLRFHFRGDAEAGLRRLAAALG